MPLRARPSRTTYREYRAADAEGRWTPPGEADDPRAARPSRGRSFFALAGGLWGLLRGHRLTVAAALLTLTVSTAIALTTPASTKIAIDYILTDNPGPSGLPEWVPGTRERVDLLWLLGGALVVAALLSVAFGLWGRFQMTRLVKRMQVHLRRTAFRHAVRLPLHRIHSIKSGGVASVLREDAGGAGELIFNVLYNPWRAVVQFTGTLVILAVVDWRLLIGSLMLIPLIWATHRTWINRIRPVYRDIRRSRQSIDGRAAETFGGMRVVRGFGRERTEGTRFVKRNHLMIRQEMLAWWRARLIDVSWSVLAPVASAAVLVYGGTRVVEGSLTIGDVMMFSAYLLMLLGPLETLAMSATNAQNNLAGFDRLLDLFEEPTELASQSDALPVDRSRVEGRIGLRGVSFRYPRSGDFSLEGIDLDVRAGEVIALVGASGAGKTTLCNLIARFYDPDEGRVELDGTDVRHLDLDGYRSLLGVVEQDVFLFDGTIAENIAYARGDASFEEIREAALAANAAEFIEGFDEGYETIIGERGVRLSGGQKQRIAIARAVLADPRILILDEATSNLDTRSERLIQASLAELMRGRTSFVIAHRLSTIRHADRIVVLRDGRIEQVGSHEELLARGGGYADLLRLQLADADEAAGLLGDAAQTA
jgi:ATP-binding cassette subfamily B protein/subfamily B ATP-binding cassette protein MsbA